MERHPRHNPQRHSRGRDRHRVKLAALFCLTFLGLGGLAASAADDGADGQFNQRTSSHFKLLQDVDIDRYSGPQGSRAFEVAVLDILEDAYDAVGEALSIRPRRRIQVYVYDPGIFDAEFSRLFGVRIAGFFNGTIHVRGGARIDGQLVQTLHHEYVHAALDWRSRGAYPAWLNEGIADYFGARAVDKRHLSLGEFGFLQRVVKHDAWIPLENLNTPNLLHLVGDNVAIAYLESYALVEFMVRTYGMRDLREVVEILAKTRNAKRALRRAYRATLSELEMDLVKTLR